MNRRDFLALFSATSATAAASTVIANAAPKIITTLDKHEIQTPQDTAFIIYPKDIRGYTIHYNELPWHLVEQGQLSIAVQLYTPYHNIHEVLDHNREVRFDIQGIKHFTWTMNCYDYTINNSLNDGIYCSADLVGVCTNA
jgi:hypothetical protein